MTSFHSKQYPKSRNKLAISQEYAMQYYAGINVVIMVYVMLSVVSGNTDMNLLWGVLIAEVVAVVVGNWLGQSLLQRTWAEIFFVGEHFSLISVGEILDKPNNHAFPLRLANPFLDPDQDKVTFHFNDQVITLRRKDWEEFDLIVDYLYSRTF
ncbi:MAG: hypothetical protein AAFY71_00185 [Bacteroidota bacterium]